MAGVRLGVFDEHEIFRRGVLACVSDHPDITASTDPTHGLFDVAVASVAIATSQRLSCPVLLCAPDPRPPLDTIPNRVVGILVRGQVTPKQLVAAIRAAAAGLSVTVPSQGTSRNERAALDPRAREVLEALAAGQDTQQIADALGYSERTIKQAITMILAELGARNRTQAVAEGIRLGVI